MSRKPTLARPCACANASPTGRRRARRGARSHARRPLRARRGRSRSRRRARARRAPRPRTRARARGRAAGRRGSQRGSRTPPTIDRAGAARVGLPLPRTTLAGGRRRGGGRRSGATGTATGASWRAPGGACRAAAVVRSSCPPSRTNRRPWRSWSSSSPTRCTPGTSRCAAAPGRRASGSARAAASRARCRSSSRTWTWHSGAGTCLTLQQRQPHLRHRPASRRGRAGTVALAARRERGRRDGERDWTRASTIVRLVMSGLLAGGPLRAHRGPGR